MAEPSSFAPWDPKPRPVPARTPINIPIRPFSADMLNVERSRRLGLGCGG